MEMMNDKSVKEVKAALNEFAEAYGEHRLDRLASLFRADSEVHTFGADAQELAMGATDLRAAFEHDWNQRRAGAIRLSAERIQLAGHQAYVDAEAILSLGAGAGEEQVRARFSAGLEKSGNTWQFKRMHFQLNDQAKAAQAHAAHREA